MVISCKEHTFSSSLVKMLSHLRRNKVLGLRKNSLDASLMGLIGYKWFVQEPNERAFRSKTYSANFFVRFTAPAPAITINGSI